MTEQTDTIAPADVQTGSTQTPEAELTDELLVEEISIDGMCGVY